MRECILACVLFIYTVPAICQRDETVLQIPEQQQKEFLQAVTGKLNHLYSQLNRETERTLRHLYAQEQKLLQKIERKDPGTGKNCRQNPLRLTLPCRTN